MSYTKLHYDDVESKGGLYFLRDPLGCDALGVSVIDVEDGREGPAHDHGDEDHEEVYVLVEGDAELTIDGESVAMDPGDAIRVAPETTRQLSVTGDSTLIIAGAP